MKKSLIVFSLFLFVSSAQAGWFGRDPDPVARPNIFSRIGKGLVDSVTGIFKKKEESIEVLPVEPLVDSEPRPRSFPSYEPIPLPKPVKVTPKPRILPVQNQTQTAEEYIQELKQLILNNARLPAEAGNARISESVRVYFVIYPSGELGNVYIPEQYRSEKGYLNEAAMTSVYRAARYFKPFPPSMKSNSEKLFSIPITFKN